MRNLYNFVDFYQSHPDIFHAVSGESKIVNAVSAQSEVANILQSLTAKSLSNSSQQPNILQTLTAKSPIRLTWSHYSIILQEGRRIRGLSRDSLLDVTTYAIMQDFLSLMV